MLKSINEKLAPKVKIKTEGTKTVLYIDGHKINGVTKINFNHSVAGEVPMLQIDINGTNLELDADFLPELPEPWKEIYSEHKTI